MAASSSDGGAAAYGASPLDAPGVGNPGTSTGGDAGLADGAGAGGWAGLGSGASAPGGLRIVAATLAEIISARVWSSGENEANSSSARRRAGSLARSAAALYQA